MDRIAVFYRPEQVAETPDPSPRKPRLVVADWQQAGLLIDLQSFEPLTARQIALAHDPGYVAGVLACRQANGFRNKDPKIAQSLPYTTSSLVCACEHVMTVADHVACSPTSGFHHAHYDAGGGFCTFNGLVIAAMMMRESGLVLGRVGILDCDFHYGDGTQEIIDRLGLSWIRHVSLGQHFYSPQHAAAYLRAVRKAADELADQCALVIYQAGADVHRDDPLGGVLSTRQTQQRDEIVFSTFAKSRARLVWTLAGGYQEEPDGSIPKVLEIHRNTMRACIEAYL